MKQWKNFMFYRIKHEPLRFVFRTEIPEVNQDDNPDNDVAYDSFEVKINYPLPYPQIIEKGQIRNSIDGLTHRSLADSCEIEYVKKNGEIINDLDDDGEIQEKERLHFPVWQGPDYEDEENWKDINSREDDDDKPEQKNYFISNMIYNQEEVKPLDQTQFIAKNAKFKIKIIDKSVRTDFIHVNLKSVIKENRKFEPVHEIVNIKCEKIQENRYESEYFYTVQDDYLDTVIDIEGFKFKILKISQKKYLNNKIIIEYKIKSIERARPEKAAFVIKYWKKTKEGFLNHLQWFNKIFDSIENLGYTCQKEVSPTKKELLDNLEYYSIFYFDGHGSGGYYKYWDGDDYVTSTQEVFLGFCPSIKNNQTNKLDYDWFTYGDIDKDLREKLNYDLLFLNVCHSGEEGRIENNKLIDSYLNYKESFNAKNYIGFSDTVNTEESGKFAKLFFEYCKEFNIGNAYKNIIDNNDFDKVFLDKIQKNFTNPEIFLRIKK